MFVEYPSWEAHGIPRIFRACVNIVSYAFQLTFIGLQSFSHDWHQACVCSLLLIISRKNSPSDCSMSMCILFKQSKHVLKFTWFNDSIPHASMKHLHFDIDTMTPYFQNVGLDPHLFNCWQRRLWNRLLIMEPILNDGYTCKGHVKLESKLKFLCQGLSLAT